MLIETVESEQHLGFGDLPTPRQPGAGLAVRVNGRLYPVAAANVEHRTNGRLMVLDLADPDGL